MTMTPSNPTRQEIFDRAKEIIEAMPTAGKARVNELLRVEYGVGLRSSKILELKREVSEEKPLLFAELYRSGSVGGGLNDIYKGWRDAGFLPSEARELTVGRGSRYKDFDARAVYNSEPGQAARRTRRAMVQQQLDMGWSKKRIRDNIVDFYMRIKDFDPWEHIRAEYKPRQKIDFVEYEEKRRRRAKGRQRRLLFTHRQRKR